MSSQPSPTIIATTVEDLRRHAPFDAMDDARLAWLAPRLRLTYHPKGSVLIAPETKLVDRLFIVQKGEVSGRDMRSGDGGWVLTLSEGESFPLGALIAQRPTTLTFTASQDSFCYELMAAEFEHLMDTSAQFRHFATDRLATLLAQSSQAVQRQYTARVSTASSMSSPLKSLIRRAPVCVGPSSSIRTVLETMKRMRIGSVVIVTDAQKPLGIFTERDVLDRVALGEVRQDSAIETVMTPEPFTLPSHAAMFEAAQAMARYRFRHVVVMEEGEVCGVISERDLFALQRLSLGEIAKAVEHAETIEELVDAAASVRQLASALLAQGVGAEQLTQFVTTLNDAIVQRALEFAAVDAAPPPIAWCWLGLGSEGRMEQTLATDQDNAIVFEADSEAAVHRPAFLAFANRANVILDRCGFPLCKGEIMARNPRWCLSLAEWRETFERWIWQSDPEALLNAAIFFDLRPLAGDRRLADLMRDGLNHTVSARPLFLRQMAAAAREIEPPLGLFRDFVVDDDADLPGTVDLKKFGARPFIDAARIFALQTGLTASNTAERLRLAGRRMRMHDDEVAAYVDAFHFIQMLRLRTQDQGPQTSHPNRINPDQLNALDRRILKEALRQARKLQTRLALDFQL